MSGNDFKRMLKILPMPDMSLSKKWSSLSKHTDCIQVINYSFRREERRLGEKLIQLQRYAIHHLNSQQWWRHSEKKLSLRWHCRYDGIWVLFVLFLIAGLVRPVLKETKVFIFFFFIPFVSYFFNLIGSNTSRLVSTCPRLVQTCPL